MNTDIFYNSSSPPCILILTELPTKGNQKVLKSYQKHLPEGLSGFQGGLTVPRLSLGAPLGEPPEASRED